MTKAFLIDAAAKIVREVTLPEGDDELILHAMQKYIGGNIQEAMSWDNGDTLFVDEEGLLKPQEFFFRIAGREHPLVGNGLLVGTAVDISDPVMRLETLTTLVKFITRFQMDAWAKANASDPVITISIIEDGERKDTIVVRAGEVYGGKPPDKG